MLLSARSDKSAAGVIMRQGADPGPGAGAGVTPAPGYHAPLMETTCFITLLAKILNGCESTSGH